MRTDTIGRLVEIGVVGRPHGVTGEVRIFLHNPESTVIVESSLLYLKQTHEISKTRLLDVRRGARCYLARFEGITSRTTAETLKGSSILVARDEFPDPEEDEFYVADLIGLSGYWGDSLIGEITSSRPQGGIEVVTVTGEKEGLEIPLVEDFVAELDITGGKVVFKDIEDLPRYPLRSRGGT